MRVALSMAVLSACIVVGHVNAGTITVDYTVDAGGSNHNPLNGLAARAKFDTSGNVMTILLQNTSTGMPSGFDSAASLLVSLGLNLPSGVTFLSGNTAVIGPGSAGLGNWSARGPGDSVAEEWAWTNQSGGDLLDPFSQVISTSNGNQGLVLFGGGNGSVGGPYGGIAAKPVLTSIPNSQRAVSNSILFSLTLSAPITDAQLTDLANHGLVEFGSDVRYLQAPEPQFAILIAVGLLSLRRRRNARTA